MSTKFNGTDKGPLNHLQTLIVACLAVVALTSATSSMIPFARGDSINPGVYSINSKPFGISYGNWTTTWEQWLLSEPQVTNPATNRDRQELWPEPEGPCLVLSRHTGRRGHSGLDNPCRQGYIIWNNKCRMFLLRTPYAQNGIRFSRVCQSPEQSNYQLASKCGWGKSTTS